ncbi:MAG TPA: hypothetical protein VF212_01760 [Longimicrobiales bacterium]
MTPVETCLAEPHRIRATGAGTDETSYYGPLRALLNAVGETLRPRVHCVMQIRQQGAGLPDGGLFTEDQLPGDGVPALEGDAAPDPGPGTAGAVHGGLLGDGAAHARAPRGRPAARLPGARAAAPRAARRAARRGPVPATR